MKQCPVSCVLLVLLLAIPQFFQSCTKTKHNPQRLSTVNPFQKYFSDNGSQVQISIEDNSLPIEIGYSFTSSDTGSVYKLGVNLPDTGKSYTVTLWDSASQNVLVRKNVLCATSGFSYVDLSATGESVELQANHSYVISVYLTPVNLPGAGPARFFDAIRTDRQNIFPLTEGYITYHLEFTKTSYSPAFPDNLSAELDVINGLVDIGFSHLSN